MTAFWTLAAALLGGTTAMRAAGKTYLPQWPGEPDDAYEKRLKVAVLFPAYKRTVSTLSGKPFSKPITIGEGVPEQMQEWLEDCDLQGRSLHVFASDMFQLALGYGMAGILVEYPRVNREPGTPSYWRGCGRRNEAVLRAGRNNDLSRGLSRGVADAGAGGSRHY
jgi:hypothetical protein